MRHQIRARAIVLAVLLAVLAAPRTGDGQPAVELASINGIRAADKTKTPIAYCRGVAAAMNAAADAIGELSLFGGAPPEIKGGVGEDIVEKALGITKNTQSYANGARIPDFRDGDKWYEVKNTRRQGWSRQLQQTWAAASKSGKTYTIVTRYDTKLSERLWRKAMRSAGKIRILKCLPPMG